MDSAGPPQETDSLLKNPKSNRVQWDPREPPESLYEKIVLWRPTVLPADVVAHRCWMLSLAAMLWSTGPVIIKSLLDQGCTPVAINQWRFFFAMIVLLPWTPGIGAPDCLEHPNRLQGKQIAKRDKWWLSMQLGFWQFLSITFAAVGLQYTTAIHASFLLHLHVKVLPFLTYFLYGRRITFTSWFSSIGAVIGVALLTTNESATQTYGDIWCLAAAFARGFHIVTLEHAQKSANGMELTSASLWIATVVNILSMILSRRHISILLLPLVTGWGCLVFLSMFATAFVTPLLTWGKANIPVKEWALIHVFDTLFGALFAMWYINESMTIVSWVGAVAIIGAVFIQQQDAGRNESPKSKGKDDEERKVFKNTLDLKSSLVHV